MRAMVQFEIGAVFVGVICNITYAHYKLFDPLCPMNYQNQQLEYQYKLLAKQIKPVGDICRFLVVQHSF